MPGESARKEIDAFCGENEKALFEDVARLVAIDSREGPPEEGAPFGKGPARALDAALAIAERLGLKAVNRENRIGYALLGDDSDRYLATVSHLDVVPPGDGWKGDPFLMRERDGWILGRGVMDDKGPSVLCLYALKFLKERGVPLRYPVRALLGINEETGSRGVEYYLSRYAAPLFCFSPDADFPLCNGEKGLCLGRLTATVRCGSIVRLQGGVAPNVIPSKAEAVVRARRLFPAAGVTAEDLGDGTWRIGASGVGGHASRPEGTENAIGVLIRYLLGTDALEEGEAGILRFLARLHNDWSGELLGIAARDDRFEPLTVTGGMIGLEDGYIVQTLDSRYPTTTDGRKILSAVARASGGRMTAELIRDTPPFYTPPDSPAVGACLAAYNEVTGESAKPFTIGGGTYARLFPNAVSFGPEHPDRPRPAFAGPIHGAEEGASKEDLLEALRIYILALLKLETLGF